MAARSGRNCADIAGAGLPKQLPKPLSERVNPALKMKIVQLGDPALDGIRTAFHQTARVTPDGLGEVVQTVADTGKQALGRALPGMWEQCAA